MALVLFLLLLPSIFFTTEAQIRDSNISLGSSCSPTNNSYWLSASRRFGFGVYPYGNGFSVGIWYESIPQKTVVWTANRDEPPFPADATLLLSTDGRLVVQQKQGQETLIANASFASSASMLDSGPEGLGMPKIYSADACTRKSKQSFDVYELSSVTWEEDPYATLQELSKDDCREECFRNCNCEVALYGSARQICKMLKLPLRYGRRRLGGRWTTFVKIGTGVRTIVGGKGKKSEVRMDIFITGIGSLTLAFFVLASSGIFIYRHRIQQSRRVSDLRDNGFVEEVTLKSFTYEELKHATNNFTDNIGKGAFGTVFRGVISNGKKIVAIKRLEKVVAEGEREFRNEVKAIGQTHHKNLVQLLGYCYDGTNRLLVYEYMRNGSLADFLFRSSLKINWEGRIAIILNIARGIFYLHEECEIRIIHCDIKPENKLMDDKGYAKIADFGLAKLLMPNQSKTYTGIRGTRGYVAPEWHRNLPITVKADVYSFGIMLFEIICCRRNVEADVPDNEAVLVNWVYDCLKANELEKLLQEDEVEKEKLERVVKVGLWCTQDEPSSRPSMKKVILMLEGTVNVPDPPCPTSFLAPHRPYLSSAENNEV
ncbi:Uncharacterized protein TCM_035508 [Theobroma cacao]|uniref:non-specific serine/threonine protein kinase n=1 Tax=Theobroma cacao TaxID=3641 RepID=A0A061FII3_THECC|nr:Uncharacterized protein TCM_035508 [Theobroma cacao]